MNELLSIWLAEQGINSSYLASTTLAIGCLVIFIIASLSYYLAKYQLLKIVKRLIINSKNTWDDALIEHNVLSRMTLLLPLVLVLFLSPLILITDSLASNMLILLAKIFLTFQWGIDPVCVS